MAHDHTPYLHKLPAIDEVLRSPEAQAWLSRVPRRTLTEAVRQVVGSCRQTILGTAEVAALEALPLDLPAILQRLDDLLAESQGYRLQPVINATGVILHTNLGRSLLAPAAVANLQAVAESYSNLEYDLARGVRGSRYVHLEDYLKTLTGAEAALVVNNNAAAVFLALQALAIGREVIVSRGQLIEIGGSFRLPDIMRSSGAILREVGTTNKTHRRDYAQAISPQTALLLRVHTSNYRIMGFTAEVSLRDLVDLGRTHGIPVMEDLGSGTLVDLRQYGLHHEPTVPEVVASGVDIVTFSGDKLLGGPQAGILVGKAAHIDTIRRHPLHRAMRVDKFTIAALEASFKLYADPAQARAEIPTLAMLSMTPQALANRARRLRRRLSADVQKAYRLRVIDGTSAVGGGALPLEALPTKLLALQPTFCSVTVLEQRLRCRQPAIIGRVAQDRYLLDMRTVQERELPAIATALHELVPEP